MNTGFRAAARRRDRWLTLVCLVGAAVAVTPPATARAADAPPADKGGYTLFNPTPRELMRELSTDRPDTTESAYTVDAGHVQVELSWVDYVRNDDGGVLTERYTYLPINLKLGLTNNADLQLVFDAYARERIESDQASDTLDGFGETQLRLKVNLWGNDGGPTAFAVMPYIQFPSAQDDLGSGRVEGGVIFPLAVELPHEFKLGLMGEFDVVRNEANDGYGVELLHTVNVNPKIAGDLGGYVEYVGISPVDTGAGYVALLGAGLTYGLGEDVQLDVGVNFGLSREADDFNVFTGLSFRR